MAEKDNTSYSRGEKWWGSEGVQNPNLTAQPPLLDGAEGELLSPAATVTIEGITSSESSDRSTAASPMGVGDTTLRSLLVGARRGHPVVMRRISRVAPSRQVQFWWGRLQTHRWFYSRG